MVRAFRSNAAEIQTFIFVEYLLMRCTAGAFVLLKRDQQTWTRDTAFLFFIVFLLNILLLTFSSATQLIGIFFCRFLFIFTLNRITFCAATRIIPDGDAVYTQERLRRRDFCDGAAPISISLFVAGGRLETFPVIGSETKRIKVFFSALYFFLLFILLFEGRFLH